jgi:flagellar protein FlaJ
MATIASTGAPPIAVFRFLARMKEFGAIQQDAKDIVEMVDVLGVDIRKALELKAKHSPSKQWSELLIGMKTIIESGGNLSEYLYRMAELYSRELKRRVEQFGEMIMMVVEMYLTVVLVGGLFMIILSLIMGAMGGNVEAIKMLHVAVLYILIPLISVGMAFMIKAMLPI